MKRKILILAILISVLAITGLVVWKRIYQAVPTQTFTIVKAWWPAWDTFQMGVLQREKKDQRFQAKFLQKDDYVLALDAFESDSVDGATLTIYEAILAVSKGIPIKIVLMLDYTVGSDGVVAKKSIATLLDLKGKRVGIEPGTIAHFTVLKALENAGLDHAEVQMVELSLDGLQKAFIAGEIDAAGTYEPYMSSLASMANGHIVFSSKEIPRSICDVLFVKERVVGDHPDILIHWIRAWCDALDTKRNKYDEYLQTLSMLNKTSVQDLGESLKGFPC